MNNIVLDRSKTRVFKIVDVNEKVFLHPTKGIKKKLELTMVNEEGFIFNACAIWDRNKVVRALYFNGNTIHYTRPLGQFLEFLKVKSTNELIGKQVNVLLTEDNYWLPITFDPEILENDSKSVN